MMKDAFQDIITLDFFLFQLLAILRTYGIHGRTGIGRDRNTVFEISQEHVVPTGRNRIFFV